MGCKMCESYPLYIICDLDVCKSTENYCSIISQSWGVERGLRKTRHNSCDVGWNVDTRLLLRGRVHLEHRLAHACLDHGP